MRKRYRESCDGYKKKTAPALPKVKTSAKSVQTSAEVCADYG